MKEGIFVFSIDLGILLGKSGEESEEAIKGLLDLFELYDIPVTWAIVGCLFDEYGEIMDRITQRIINCSTAHEIGFHSFMHINYSERSSSIVERDVLDGKKLADTLSLNFTSFVFPDNAIGHLDILRENGFIIYRGKNISHNKELTIQQLFSNLILDRLVAKPVDPNFIDGIWEIPASMQFYDPIFSMTLELRAKLGIRKAIYDSMIFHIWLHPQDIIKQPNLMSKLDSVLNYASDQRRKGRLKIYTMGQLGLLLDMSRKKNKKIDKRGDCIENEYFK